jgi:hypothetical protein
MSSVVEVDEIQTQTNNDAITDDILSTFRMTTYKRQEDLLCRLSQTPMHAVSLRRNKYKVIRRITKEMKWPIVKDKDASFVWLDKWDIPELSNLRNYKIGHFPGMGEVGSKCSLGRTLTRIRNEFPNDYDFFPLSFVLPTDREKLIEYDETYRNQMKRAIKKKVCVNSAEGHPMANPGGYPPLAPPSGCWAAPGSHPQPQAGYGDRLVYIVKPDAGSRGQGIYLALSLEDIEEFGADNDENGSDENDDDKPGNRHRSKQTSNWRPSSGASTGGTATDDEDGTGESVSKPLVMVQAYLPRPLLMDNRKFDLRIYVLVTSVFPTLRLFVYRQGLVRFATVTYAPPNESNISSRRMFLTNYAVNKPGERPRSPKTGIDDVPDGAVRSSAPPLRFDANPGGGADDNGDDSDEGEDGEGNVGLASATRRAPLPTREKAIELVRARLGCKWTLTSLFESLDEQGIDTERLWERIKDVITKTILAVRPTLAQKYKAARPHLKFEAAPVIDKPKRKTVPRPFFASRPTAAVPSRDEPEAIPTTEISGVSSLNTASAVTAAAAAAIAAATASLAPPAPVPLSNLVSSTGIFGVSISGIRTERLASESAKKKLEDSTKSKAVPAPGAALFGLGLVGTPVTLVTSRPLPPTKAPIARKVGMQRAIPTFDTVGVSMYKPSLTISTLPLSHRSSSAEPRSSVSLSSESEVQGTIDSDSVSVAASTSASSTSASQISEPTSRMIQSRLLEKSMDTINNTKRRSASVTASEVKVKEADVAAASVAWGAGSGVSAKGANEMTLEDDDGEQGFRCFELMGLDIILDMSHCVCEHSLDHQNLQSKDPSKWKKVNKAGLQRCQPRPVLLEINQSCSMHSDSDLDRVVKGDVVTDAFNLSAPDEQWLLQQFAEAVKSGGGLAAVSASAGTADLDAGGDSNSIQEGNGEIAIAAANAKNAAVSTILAAPPVGPSPALMESVLKAEAILVDSTQSALLTLKSNTGTVIDNRNCMNDFPKAHKTAVDMSKAAIEESAALLHAFRRGFPPIVLEKKSKSSKIVSISNPSDMMETAQDTSNKSDISSILSLQAQRIEALVPWTPLSMGSLYTAGESLVQAWQQEIWFGQPWHLRDREFIVGTNNLSISKENGPLGQLPAFSNVVRTVMALKKKEKSTVNNEIDSVSSTTSATLTSTLVGRQTKDLPPAWSLGTIPQLSPRAQLVLLLRRTYEHQHMGGFERLSPPIAPQLSERYRRIIEFIPPSMRETFAFAKRRMEALALRAATEAKRSALIKGNSK